MITPIGTAGIDSLLREVKKSEEEDRQIYRQQANTFFDQKIASLEDQANTLREQAKKIGSMGIFNFVCSLVTAAMSLVGGALGAAKGALAAKTTGMLTAIQNGLGIVQDFINTQAAATQKKLEAKMKDQEIRSEIQGKSYEMVHEQEMDAKKRGQEAMDTLKEARRNVSAAHEAMVQ
ncbi:MAG: hypothetical protein Q7T11_01390 [Deltaproteobacteria bacterium]|nr:hypothetical protein [Deltaproteobacteria bacterium]